MFPSVVASSIFSSVSYSFSEQILCLLCCCCSVIQSCLTLCNPSLQAHQASLSFTISWSLLELMSIDSVMPCNHLILCRPPLLLPSIFLSIRVFSNELALCIKQPKYWNFSISLSNEYSGLISLRIDQFDLLAVQETLKSLLQQYNFESINSSGLSLPYSPTLIFVNDYRKSPEKATAPHSSTLAWKIPWMEEPGRLQSMGSLRVGHN